MNWQAILTGIGAIITSAGGCFLVIREMIRRDRKAIRHQLSDMSGEVSVLRADLVACRAYAFHIAEHMAALGVEIPEAPVLRSDHE